MILGNTIKINKNLYISDTKHRIAIFRLQNVSYHQFGQPLRNKNYHQPVPGMLSALVLQYFHFRSPRYLLREDERAEQKRSRALCYPPELAFEPEFEPVFEPELVSVFEPELHPEPVPDPVLEPEL